MSAGTPLEPAPHSQLPPAKSTAGKGLGIAALVIAIVALTLCWVPIVNNFAAVLGFVALILGIISLAIAAKRRGSKGLGIASSVIAIVAIVLVFVTQSAYVKALDGVSAAIDDAADGEVAAPEKVIEQAADESQVLKLGEAATIGEYSVNVSSVNLEADEAMAKANSFNEKAEGQYVLVDLSVVYNGEEEGDAWLDLSPELVGSDSRIYSTSSSMAMAPKPAMDVPTLTKGGKGTYQVVFDVPADALDDAKIRVTETLSFDDEAGLWETK
ncbi:hypothetical protein CIK76_13820 [Glutamicibacter sp. BW80]|uniref:DUF4190 domain-containing protein n=1 Tax=unclassified Glutamicibacter TaxID=2627139 RepID=UPI000BB6ED32|nr:DUF4190 domain-containing protein [Glutamicibacter sp. BW80]PCC27944.1 hypothetical protein CIK76_13820 [Glutamicibacter sp. BW80]